MLVVLTATISLTASSAPPVYAGPTCSSLTNCVASVELNGLFVEVADSIVAPGGRGLFIRCADGIEGVTVGGATPLCGYADGGMELIPDSEGGKTVAFALREPSSAVFFEKELHSVGSLLEAGLSIAGHDATLDSSGMLASITLDESYDGPRYFVPREPMELSVMNIGQFANDLAIGGSQQPSTEYYEKSRGANLIVLVQRLERHPCALESIERGGGSRTRTTTSSTKSDVFAALPCSVNGTLCWYLLGQSQHSLVT